jgi:hypothetical protein
MRTTRVIRSRQQTKNAWWISLSAKQSELGMNNTRLEKTLLLALGIIGFAPMMRGADQYLKIDYPASAPKR